MSLFEQVNYVRHLLKLMVESPVDRRFYLFALVGISGVIINMVIYYALVQLGVWVPLSGVFSAGFAMVSNFILNDHVTWAGVRESSWASRATKYLLTSLLGVAISGGVLTLLYRECHMHYLLANLGWIVCSTVSNYLINNTWTWRSSAKVTIDTKTGTTSPAEL